jgi:hypothetical protein
MHLYKNKRSGFAVEAAILVGVLVVGAGWFGVREASHALKELKQENAVKDANDAAAKAKTETDAALVKRQEATAALEEEKKARAIVEAKARETGRTIQRSSTQGSIAAGQLPESRQRDHLTARFDEIDSASTYLFGEAPPSDVQVWRQRALDALAGNAAAQAELDKQKQEIKRLGQELGAAKSAQEVAQKKADDLQIIANTEQKKAAGAVARTATLTQQAANLFADNSGLASLVTILKLVVIAAGGLWVLGIFLKSFAMGLPGNGAKPAVMHNVANAFLSLLSPMSVLGEVRARRDTEKLIEGTGTFIADLRATKTDLAPLVTQELDAALSPSHQRRIRAASIQYLKERAAAAAEAASIKTG